MKKWRWLLSRQEFSFQMSPAPDILWGMSRRALPITLTDHEREALERTL